MLSTNVVLCEKVALLVLTEKIERLKIKLRVKRLFFYNLFSRADIVGDGGPVVSLTSYGKRVPTAYLAIESIGLGELLPSKIILWLDDQQVANNLPRTIRRLKKRGLEVRVSPNFGPHTKYYPALPLVGLNNLPLVTADDDILYPPNWLKALFDAYLERPDCVNCFRAHVIKIDSGKIAPYATWQPCQSGEPSFRHFATGVSGVAYPPKMVTALREAGDAFMSTCPKADDVWLHVTALRNGFKIRQIGLDPIHFTVVPNTQEQGLMHSNLFGGANDGQIQLVYNEEDLQKLELNS